jgi:parallel beta-helix repeat protein
MTFEAGGHEEMTGLNRRKTAWAAGMGVLVALVVVPIARAATTAATPSPPPGVGANPADCAGGIVAHAPIAITTDAGWSPYVNPGGSGTPGTPGDPFLISCISIQVLSTSGKGIAIASAAMDKSFVIRDVIVSGPGPAGTSAGISLGSTAAAATRVVEQSTVSGVSNGIADGASDLIETNAGSGNGACIDSLAADTVTGNWCTASSSEGYLANAAGSTFTGNTAVANPGNGFVVEEGTITHNVSENNGGSGFIFGFAPTTGSNALVDSNTAVGNAQDGIDFSGADNATISNNIVQGNGGVGIQSDPANGFGEYEYSTKIVGNHIGDNAYGISLFGPAPGNEVWGTDWTDGRQSITDFADQSTVVDAGSTEQVAFTTGGATVSFTDYLARVTLGNTAPNSSIPQQAPLVTNEVTSIQPAVQTAVRWDFPGLTAGSSVCPSVTVTDPSQGHGPPPPVTCTYPAPGTYVAVLTVSGLALSGQPVSFSDSVPVVITQGA